VNSLAPRQTGCLRAGVYVEDVTVRTSHIVLRAYPGEHARLVGRLRFRPSSGDDVITHLTLDGRNTAGLPSPTVNGSAIRFVEDEVTNLNTHICFVIGSSGGRASATVIERSRIHNCGQLPRRNKQHGIYVENAEGTRIVGNLIYENADRGIQLYPNAQHTLVERNVIDGNGTGIIFSGGDGVASNDNIVQYNIISNSRVRADIESWYPSGAPLGVGNVVRNNCLFGGRTGTIAQGDGGFTATANVVANPMYANAPAGDFRVAPTSPCSRVLQSG
jgi:parallel beta-helix repeat protein